MRPTTGKSYRRLSAVNIATTLLLVNGAFAYSEREVEDGGSVQGRLRFGDEYPRAESIRIDRDVETCGTRHQSERFVIDPETKGLKDAVASLVGVAGGKPLPKDLTLSINQVGCRYTPHVQIGYSRKDDDNEGSVKLLVLNSDDVFHNVHAFAGEETVFNTPSLPDQDLSKWIDGPGFYEVKCDIHPWMSAWIAVFDHPYVALSDESGEFVIEQVPPGEYTLRLWHEGLGTIERSVEIRAGEKTLLDFPLGKSE